jgi:PKD repeat protein
MHGRHREVALRGLFVSLNRVPIVFSSQGKGVAIQQLSSILLEANLVNPPAMYLALRALVVSIIISLIPGVGFAASHSTHGTTGTPWTGKTGISETVGDILKRDTHGQSQKINEQKRHKQDDGGDEEEDVALPNSPASPAVSQWPPPSSPDSGDATRSPQSVGTSFLGAQLSEAPFVPPDSMGAVGPSQVVVIVNGRLKVFNKSGVLGAVNTTTDNFFSSVRNGSSTSDPHVRYDRLSGRWFIVMINVATTKNRVLIAVSGGPTIDATSTFTFYQFAEDFDGGDANQFADYPTLGVDALALYIGVNMFTSSSGGSQGRTGFVVNKASLLSGGPITVTSFRGLDNDGAGNGIKTPQGVDNDDPNATEGYFIGTDGFTAGQLDVRRIFDPGGTPTISGTLVVTVPTTGLPIPQAHRLDSLNKKLDALNDRLFAAALHKNKITGVSTLWTAHNFEVDTNGVAQAGGGRNGSRWYEIGNLTSTPSLIQSGTLFHSVVSNPRGFWIPSVAMSGQGHMALGCSYAGTNDQAGVAVSGRFRTDPLGTIQAPTLAVVSSFGYNVGDSGTVHRWGDFSQTVVDPADDMTMWTFQEYTSSTSSWGVRAVQLKAPLPATPISVFPASMIAGQSNVDLSITGASVSGSEFFDPGPDTGGPGYTNHTAAAINGGGILVNSVTFVGPTNITMNVTVLPGATSGARTITVTNPDGQTKTSASAILMVYGVPVPAFTANATSGVPSLAVTFTNLSTGATNYTWDFGDGKFSTATNASNVYTNVGKFGVTLTASGPAGSSAITRTNYISVVTAPFITMPTLAGTNLSFSFGTLTGFSYIIQFKDSLTNALWQNGQVVNGDGTIQTVFVPTTTPTQRFFRLLVQ